MRRDGSGAHDETSDSQTVVNNQIMPYFTRYKLADCCARSHLLHREETRVTERTRAADGLHSK